MLESPPERSPIFFVSEPTTRKISPDMLADARRQSQRFSLIVYHRDGAQVVPLRPEEAVVIGRERPSHVRIQDDSLSREHARFLLSEGQVSVEDTGSLNGTWVRGRRITEAEVRPGDEILLGQVRVSLHVLAPEEGDLLGLASHERFRAALEDEVVRSATFRRPIAMLMIRAGQRGSGEHVSVWRERVTRLLRPVDKVALYSSSTLEVLLPEMDTAGAERVAKALAEGHRNDEPQLLVGAVVHLGNVTTAEKLIELSRLELLRTTPSMPVCLRGAELSEHPGGEPAEPGKAIVGSPAMKRVFDQVKRMARMRTVLVVGETGVGKDVVARALHDESPRRSKRFIAINCGTLQGDMAKSKLFGHVKGAFTSALADRAGAFELANGGTLFLDEIGDLPLDTQVMLLRVLDDMVVIREGCHIERKVDVRVIAATWKDLEAMCRQGTFRLDLLQRLNAMKIVVPPLRERVEEIEPIAMHYLRTFNALCGTNVRGFDPEALDLMRRNEWIGNVRQLKNLIEYAVNQARFDVITADDVRELALNACESPAPQLAAKEARPAVPAVHRAPPPPRGRPSEALNLEKALWAYETQLIVDALKAVGGKQKKAAERLGIPLRTLSFKIKKFGITRGDYAAPETDDADEGDEAS
jgi:DNA-binding NtrC family response regulator